MKKIIPFVISFLLSWLPLQAMAIGETAGNLTPEQAAQPLPVDPQVANTNTNWQVGNYGVVNSKTKPQAYKVFGERIFAGGFGGIRSDGLNPQYKISPGDQVVLRIWGATEIERVLPVDAQGNIFIPTIGPVQVMGVSQGQLNQKVTAAVKTIYSDNVGVYTQLQGVQPISVFVTGFVNKPGRYAGTPNDSVLYFINQAQGIDSAEGSYRTVELIRDGIPILAVDLYAFLTQGYLPKLQLVEGDTLFIKQRGSVVTVIDESSSPTLYELKDKQELGSQILNYMVLNADISHVLLHGFDLQKPFSKYITLAQFKASTIKDGDQLVFAADKKSQSIMVQVEGSYLGTSNFILPNDAKLTDLLNIVPVDAALTDTGSVSIRRKSIAEQQKISLEASLKRLENTYLTASSDTSEEAKIRVQEAGLITSFVKRAADIEPNGRLVVSTAQGVANIRLQDGDVITIPSQSESVLISGQILVPTSFVYQSGLSIEDYIAKAGGYTEQADEDKIVLIRQSGEVIADAHAVVMPGDEILVLPKVPTKNIQLATSISQILFQIAVATKVAFSL